MVALVIGLGSMGRRRARLLREIDKEATIVGVDLREKRRRRAQEELGMETCASMKSACEKYRPNIAFVCASPLSHASVIKECLENNMHVFTEINLTDAGYEDNVALAKEKNKILFLSSTLLYRKETQYIKKAARESECNLTYVYHVGQYLPDWHPWEGYKDFFVGDRRTNGCRELMAIELPWIMDAFGEAERIVSFASKNSSLEVDYPDTHQMTIFHKTGRQGTVVIDVVSRKPVRNFELFGEKIYLTWDGTPEGLNRYDYETGECHKIKLYESVDQRSDYSPSIVEDAYKSEIVNFLNCIQGSQEPFHSFEKDKAILGLIDEVENYK